MGVWGCKGISALDTADSFVETGTRSDTNGFVETGGDSDTGDPQSTLEQSGVILCEDPSLRDTLGPFEFMDLGPGWLTQLAEYDTSEDFLYGYGLAVGDINDDTWPDIVLAHLTRPQLWMGSAEGQWTEESAERLPRPDALTDGQDWSSTLASLADVDGDGDLDLYVSTTDIPDQMYLNDGTGHFENWTIESGLPTTIEGVRGLAWGDLDGDLDLDLLVGANGPEEGDYGDPNYVLINDGTGRFEDGSARLSEEERVGYTQVVGILDFDGDAAQDMYIINHRPEYVGNRMLFNDGASQFSTDADAGANLDMQGMGLGIGDLNDDGLPDLFLADSFGLKLLVSAAPRLWAESAIARGLTIDMGQGQVSSWSTHLEDMNNDGLLDAAATFGPVQSVLEAGQQLMQPDELWLQQEDGQFQAVGPEWGLAHTGYGRTLGLVDLNQDGHLDWLLNSRQEPAIALLSRCSAASWVRVELRDVAPNTRAIGSQIQIDAGGKTHRRWLSSGSTGMCLSQVTDLHVGLGEADTIDRLMVTWPDGEVEVWEDLAARQVIRITR